MTPSDASQCSYSGYSCSCCIPLDGVLSVKFTRSSKRLRAQCSTRFIKAMDGISIAKDKVYLSWVEVFSSSKSFRKIKTSIRETLKRSWTKHSKQWSSHWFRSESTRYLRQPADLLVACLIFVENGYAFYKSAFCANTHFFRNGKRIKNAPTRSKVRQEFPPSSKAKVILLDQRSVDPANAIKASNCKWWTFTKDNRPRV